ncbi:MAG: NAD(P)-dependent oxidoreductase [Lachnospiraceae bacterium]|nr:NAD(P)-dependent oxidoreductase [Lachnospiraceae bacterium]MBQ6903695.1 NAD(P)-dependent oxidoreductase [Lachnospiraceae bacterium]
MKTIGFVGVGIMGKPMVRNLMKAGFSLLVYARDKSKVEDVIAEGAVFCATLKEIAEQSEALITMVGFPKDVEEVYFGEGKLLESAKEGTYLIDMTTTSPSLAVRIFEEGKKRGLHVLDAPVTGGDIGAVKGTLSILCGGEKEDFEACKEVFEAVGNNINHMGEAGCGQHAKMANQIVIAGTMSGICEAFTYAKKAGLNLQTVFDAISTGAASSAQMSTNGAKMLKGDFAPGFKLTHFVKDMGIAAEEAEKAGLDLEILKETLAHYRTLEEKGMGEDGTQALIRFYE